MKGLESQATTSKFESMDFGTVVTTNTFEKVEITINPDTMLRDYGKAVARDLQRRNPVRYDAINKQVESDKVLNLKGVKTFEDACSEYVIGLVAIRMHSINEKCPEWRKAKQLLIPPYVQWVLSTLGIVDDIEHGRKFVPTLADEGKLDIDSMLAVSRYLSIFSNDGVTLLEDAFPRSRNGDEETMSFCMIDGIVRGIERGNSSKSYVSVFLGKKLKEEAAWKNVFSVRYDDASFVKDMLLQELMKW